MDITEIRVKLADNHQERLLAFCTITIDSAFVVRDVKVIEGPRGPFVAMPSRKVTARCPRCHDKNHLRANYCNNCGEDLSAPRSGGDSRGRTRLYVDIAHPINQRCRDHIERKAIEAFQEELDRSRQPGYVAPDLDDMDDDSPRRDSGDRSNGRADATHRGGSGQRGASGHGGRGQFQAE